MLVKHRLKDNLNFRASRLVKNGVLGYDNGVNEILSKVQVVQNVLNGLNGLNVLNSSLNLEVSNG
jgi:hypothetical protein